MPIYKQTPEKNQNFFCYPGQMV